MRNVTASVSAREVIREHWWKLFVIPVFFDVPDPVKYVCAAIVLASLVFDAARDVRERRAREDAVDRAR
jgi:hypothetical protein